MPGVQTVTGDKEITSGGQRKEWIYEHTGDDLARFVLGVVGADPLICFGINSSTASPNNLDPTLKRVEKYAKQNGFNGWIMLNLYSQRATDPDEMHSEIDNELHRQNLKHISKILGQRNLKLWAAWGTNIIKRDYLLGCLRDITNIAYLNECQWVMLGSSINGHPYHPLCRVKGFKLYSTPLVAFDMAGYIASLTKCATTGRSTR